MPRVKRGTVRRAKRKKLERLTKGFFQNKSKLYKFMKEAADKAGVYAYAGRKQKKRDYRSMWVQRINAAAREHGLALVTAGGRVLAVTSVAGDFTAAQIASREHADKIQYDGRQFRRDIGWREAARRARTS